METTIFRVVPLKYIKNEDLIVIYPKPYSIYLRGTIGFRVGARGGCVPSSRALGPICRKSITKGVPKIRGTFSGCPHNKDYNILESILGSPYLGKQPPPPGKHL